MRASAEAREAQIRRRLQKMVRRQIIYYLTEDLDGGETLLKEVWEACETEGDVKTVKAEVRAIIALLKKPQ